MCVKRWSVFPYSSDGSSGGWKTGLNTGVSLPRWVIALITHTHADTRTHTYTLKVSLSGVQRNVPKWTNCPRVFCQNKRPCKESSQSLIVKKKKKIDNPNYSNTHHSPCVQCFTKWSSKSITANNNKSIGNEKHKQKNMSNNDQKAAISSIQIEHR